jgi:ketosteroid isomerase-like protein
MTAGEAIRALCAAWERGDPGALAGLFSEDGVYEDPLMDGPLTGREQIREGSRPAMAAITECRVEIRHLLVDGAVAMAEGYFASRLADGSGRLDFPFAITAEMNGDLVSRIGEFYDTRSLAP